MTDQTHGASETLNGATVEVVRSYLLAAADEMRTTLIRTAFNPVIYEVFDFGISLYDENAELVAEAPGLTFFLGANDYSLRKGIEYVGRDNLFEGDIVLLNYPYWNAAHAYDATLFAPVFLPGGEQLIGYVCVRAHWMDLGAKDAGYVLDSTDVHQEGLLFPGTKVWSRGEPVHDVHELIRFNSRLPDLVLGDLHAQVSSIRTGERRFIEIVEKFGKETVDAAVAIVRGQAEEKTREALLALPQGSWSAEDLLDDDGISDDTLLMRVTVTNEGGELTIDFAGSAPAAKGPVNMPYGATIALGKVVLKNLTSRDEPSNEGTTVPLTVLAEPGTLFHAVYPAPTFTLWTGIVALELVYKALAQGMPELLAASSGGDVPGFMMVGDHPDTGEFYAISNNDPVGWGASPGHDGLNATIHLSESTVRSTPLEVLEARSGMLFERMEIRTDSGGAGRFRGGNGIVRDIRFVTPGELLSVIKKTKTRPWALAGGQEPEPNTVTTFPGTDREATVSTKRVPVQPGDLIRIESAGGGGHGDPRERDPEAVRQDVAEGYVSAEAAREIYGLGADDGLDA
ncbi:hydantoinase B/oxoprolinase family protein [Rathayibacter sp. VKM Ac-2760]|uniref:hydantoinase B/oxoprolinase family protein n=1 Tax=Rathayibacter sp. VKM Ac-2760 TaxID=2609253 RepID=UPI001318E6B6|nr:hydantoinase B/oxoprolinase family protein [Rathayibacter sp. VKM Ac-2760]QHC60165.1 hydantoinase B/oxoprolinase family protein [Rathayibacter sp. VKM Ac-2760]